jgi:hypothetical protein
LVEYVNSAKPLGALILESGEKNPNFPDDPSSPHWQRIFPVKSAWNITDETITENIFVDTITKWFADKKKDMWFERRVNLWNLLTPSRGAYDIYKRFGHPLQPDIDILYGNVVNGKRQAPMSGVEVKLFSKYSWRTIAKTTSYEGFYAGLDEAISLLSMGLDFVWLWHVQVIPRESWKRFHEYGEDFFNKIQDQSIQMGSMVSHLVSILIDRLMLPIGYLNTFLLISPEKETLSLFPNMRIGIAPELNPFLAYTTGIDRKTGAFGREQIPPRKLLLESFNLEKIKTKFGLMFCSKCSASFYRFGFRFCPLCGSKLEEKII